MCLVYSCTSWLEKRKKMLDMAIIIIVMAIIIIILGSFSIWGLSIIYYTLFEDRIYKDKRINEVRKKIFDDE